MPSCRAGQDLTRENASRLGGSARPCSTPAESASSRFHDVPQLRRGRQPSAARGAPATDQRACSYLWPVSTRVRSSGRCTPGRSVSHTACGVTSVSVMRPRSAHQHRLRPACGQRVDRGRPGAGRVHRRRAVPALGHRDRWCTLLGGADCHEADGASACGGDPDLDTVGTAHLRDGARLSRPPAGYSEPKIRGPMTCSKLSNTGAQASRDSATTASRSDFVS